MFREYPRRGQKGPEADAAFGIPHPARTSPSMAHMPGDRGHGPIGVVRPGKRSALLLVAAIRQNPTVQAVTLRRRFGSS